MVWKLSIADVQALWTKADVKGVALIDLDEACMKYHVGPEDVLNELSIKLARDYLSGLLTYEYCDSVLNGLLNAIIDFGMENALPEPAFALYRAFDQGEWIRDYGPPETVPGEKYTKPEGLKIMRNLDT